jgi:hypothetical protein
VKAESIITDKEARRAVNQKMIKLRAQKNKKKLNGEKT